MQIKSAEFITSARGRTDCPVWAHPEFAFIGRSNVGKSSMINMLSNKDSLAKVSATPGKTQLINFFIMNESWSLVDLPGYGYAQVPPAMRAMVRMMGSKALMRRVTKACSAITISQAIGMGSSARCGVEA